VTKFQDAVRRLGTDKFCPELPFETMMEAFQRYPNFVRNQSTLAILVLTDTMEETPQRQAELEKELRVLKSDPKQVRFYGTFAGQSFSCYSDQEPAWRYAGSPFEYFVMLTGGTSFDLCTPDFGKNLAQVGKDMVKSVTYSQVPLSQRPDVASLSVRYRGSELPGGPQAQGGRWSFDFDLNAVVFYDLQFALDEEDFVEIHYEPKR